MASTYRINCVLAVLLSIAVTVNSQCTNMPGCFCFSSFVTCSGLTSFPTSFPVNTKTIAISFMNTDEIPGNILNKLPELENVEIYSSNITKISSGAFEGLTLVEAISLNGLNIGTIEPFAFSNITDVGTISIYMSNIDTIESYAFSDIFAMDEINLFMLNVTEIKEFAFHKIDELLKFNFYTNNVNSLEPRALSEITNTYTFGMYLNTFDKLGCNNVEYMIDDAHESMFYSNSVNCSCYLSWAIDNARLHGHLFSNWCKVSGSSAKIYWDDITRSKLFCDVGFNDNCPDETFTETTSTAMVNINKPTTTTQTHHSVEPVTSVSSNAIEPFTKPSTATTNDRISSPKHKQQPLSTIKAYSTKSHQPLSKATTRHFPFLSTSTSETTYEVTKQTFINKAKTTVRPSPSTTLKTPRKDQLVGLERSTEHIQPTATSMTSTKGSKPIPGITYQTIKSVDTIARSTDSNRNTKVPTATFKHDNKGPHIDLSTNPRTEEEILTSHHQHSDTQHVSPHTVSFQSETGHQFSSVGAGSHIDKYVFIGVFSLVTYLHYLIV